MKKLFIWFSLAVGFNSYGQKASMVIDYDLPFEQLLDIRMKSSLSTHKIQPGLDLSLDELQYLNVHQVAVESNKLDIGFDFTLEELAELRIHSNEGSLSPDLGASINTLSKISVKKYYFVENQIDISYGMTLETLMKLSLIDVMTL